MRPQVVLGLYLALGGCGTLAQNADVPSGVYTGLEARPTIPDTASVALVDQAPAGITGTPVSGTSCQNKLWQPPPSRDNAIALMKRQAAAQGYTAIHSVSVANDPTALVKNCWAAITATGAAFRR